MIQQIAQSITNNGGQNPYVFLPENLKKVEFTGGSVTISIYNGVANFDVDYCRVDTKLKIILTAGVSIVRTGGTYQLNLSNIQASGEVFDVQFSSNRPWYQFWYEYACVFFDFIAGFGFTVQLNQHFDDLKVDVLRPAGLANESNEQLVSEAVNSFPLDFTISGSQNHDLILEVRFMRGTVNNPTAFESITVPAITNPSFDQIGFSLMQGTFHNAYGSGLIGPPFCSDDMSCIDYQLSKMKGFGAQSAVVAIPLGEVVGSSLVFDANLNPDALTGQNLTDKVNNLFSTGNWAKIDAIKSKVLSQGFEFIPLLVQGQVGQVAGIQGRPMAPDGGASGPADDGNGVLVYRVPGNVYLYYLKVFAHAAVRRYRNDVTIWKLEGELNAARFNQMSNIQWGRHGNLWQDESAGGFQDKVWRILVDAVRQNDPTARTYTGLHMLNLVKGIQRFGPDLDIVGVNPYPHDFFAAPVIGFAAGEFVWATRRALIGLGLSGKDVYVSETTYPGKVNDAAEEPPIGTSVDANLKWFSDGRQRKFMADAIQTSFSNGARGFFWWTFLDKEDSAHAFLPNTTFGSLIRKSTGEFKTATTALQSESAAKHPGKSQIQLVNKSIATNADIGGTLSVVGQRDTVPSNTPSTPVYALKQRNHISRTDQQFLAGLKHQQWNSLSSQFHLKETFQPASTDNFLSRTAFFGGTSPIQLKLEYVDGATPVTATGLSIDLRDPWRVDGAGNQPNVFNPVTVSTNYDLFLDQFVQNGTYYSARARQSTSANNLVLSFTNWTASSGTTVTNSTALETPIVFPLANSWVKANYVVSKPQQPSNILITGNPGSSPRITWTEHPSPNVVRYDIWRQVSDKYSGSTQSKIATINRGTTTYTDYDYSIGSTFTGITLYYDVRSVYVWGSNTLYSDPLYYGGLFGDNNRIAEARKDGGDVSLKRALPEEYSIAAFPNPFNPSTTVSYQLVEDADVSLAIYDLMGRKIADLVSGQKNAGYHSVQWDASNFSSGTYLYRFVAQPTTGKEPIHRSGKLLVVK